MFENDIRFKEAVSHFGEKASYQWLGLNGDEWIDQSNKVIDVDFLSDLKEGNIRNIKYQVPSYNWASNGKTLIDISELRIGNLVKIKTSNDSAYYPIYAIDGMGLKVILGGVRQCEGWKDISLLKPIRITATLLKKLGFKFEYEGDEIGEQIWRSEEGFEVWEHSKGFNSNSIDDDVKSLHQLQNLHFFITKKELYIE